MRHDLKHELAGVRPMVTADDLAHAIAHDGIGPHEQTLLWMAKGAARDGVSPTLLAAMLDQTAAEVLRQRAFGAVIRAMQNPARRPEALERPPEAAPRGEQEREAS
jgi:hypothetical protein